MRELDVGPAEIGDRLLADVADAHARQQRHRERRGDDAAAELGVARILLVEVKRVLVHGEQGKPGVVGLRDGASRPMLVDVADREVLIIAPEALAIASLAYLLRRRHHWSLHTEWMRGAWCHGVRPFCSVRKRGDLACRGSDPLTLRSAARRS